MSLIDYTYDNSMSDPGIVFPETIFITGHYTSERKFLKQAQSCNISKGVILLHVYNLNITRKKS